MEGGEDGNGARAGDGAEAGAGAGARDGIGAGDGDGGETKQQVLCFAPMARKRCQKKDCARP